jgi:hypothetical protein
MVSWSESIVEVSDHHWRLLVPCTPCFDEALRAPAPQPYEAKASFLTKIYRYAFNSMLGIDIFINFRFH